MEKAQVQYLLEQFRRKALSDAEWKELLALVQQPENEELHEIISQLMAETAAGEDMPSSLGDKTSLLHKILMVDKTLPVKNQSLKRTVNLRRLYWAAAAILIILFCGNYIYSLFKLPTSKIKTSSPAMVVIKPGKQGALLTLGNGSIVNLDSVSNGVVAVQQGKKIVMDHGQLVYDHNASSQDEMAYNMISTPNGRQFSLILPDGSKVWLDAASSIRYPTAFTSKERIVEITGQAYFEIIENSQLPFIVEIRPAGKVSVLGTAFNINAYSSTIRTSLVNGKVKVSDAENASVILTPGEQAMMQAGGRPFVVKADINGVTAWRRGMFNFENTNLPDLLNDVARWYDIEVVFAGDVLPIKFGGQVSRETSLPELLEILKLYGVRYQLSGRKLTILPAL
ncbi:FecR family protein [Chitinophaga costaii]|uniref:FecR family protein n=1 Tax=Chitinophaga costaii TaxID=1335309 RepID=A0A1C4BK57_9BACT|nr:FecR domain-containing protein [Chitinophaga costaii]PUZ27578.1 DUF4974 domain-containing protein [Chitinophaga costaii]SCC07138.1 FecR family protein [Chitinophaga costaii]